MTFGEKLIAIRRYMRKNSTTSGLNQEEFSKLICVSIGTLSRWERNKAKKSIKDHYLYKIREAAYSYGLKVTIIELKDDNAVPKCLKGRSRGIIRRRYTPETFTKVVRTLWNMRVRLGHRLKEDGMCLYQYELAEILGIHPTTVSNYQCKRRVPHPYVRRRLIDFACKYGIFLGNKDFVAYEIDKRF